MDKSEVKKCPKCGGEMEIGYLEMRRIGDAEKVYCNWDLAQEFSRVDAKVAAT